MKTALCISAILMIYLGNRTPLNAQQANNQWIQSQGPGFEENIGQITGNDASSVQFRLKTPESTVFLLNNSIVYQFSEVKKSDNPNTAVSDIYEIKNLEISTYRMDMRLVGSNPNPRISKLEKQAQYNRYSAANLEKVYFYDRVIYHDIYPNIDWVFYVNDSGMKHEFVVHPGGDPSLIKFEGKWVENMELDKEGNLILENRMGRVVEDKPTSFQEEKIIESKFKLEGNTVSYTIGSYDKSKLLIIDPQLIWGSYYGGESTDAIISISTDSQGNVYFCGGTGSTTGIADGGFLNFYSGVFSSAMLVKFSPTGQRLWATYYGSNAFTNGLSCKVDSQDNIVMAGVTDGESGVSQNGHQNNFGGGVGFFDGDAYLVKFDPSGARIWGTFFGGEDGDAGWAIDIDANDNIYLTGTTKSFNGIGFNSQQTTINAACNPIEPSDAFLAKFNSSGTLLWSRYFGGCGDEIAFGIACSPSGKVYITGRTNSDDLPNLGAQQSNSGNPGQTFTYDAFLAKFNDAGTLQWSTYYGGNQTDEGWGCAVDNFDNVYLCGRTGSNNNIFANGFQSTMPGSASFLVKFNSNGVRQWGTYYAGNTADISSNIEWAYSCAIDSDNNIYMVGQTANTNIGFQGFQNTYGGGVPGADGYMVKFSPSGSRLWASYYGGTAFDGLRACHLDPSNQLYVAGRTSSANNIFFQGFQSTQQSETGYIAKIGCPSAQLTNLPSEICANSSLQIAPFPVGGTLTLLGSGNLIGNNYSAPNVTENTEVSFQYSIGASNFCPSSSQTFSLTVLPNIVPSVSISANNLAICQNDEIEFSSNIQNAGNAPGIQWLVNNTIVAENQSAFSTNSLNNGDTVQCLVNSTNICANPTNVSSNAINITVNPLPEVSLVFAELNGGVLVASSGLSNYEWYLNGTLIPGANSSIFIPTQNGVYTVIGFNSFGCSNSADLSIVTLGLIEESPLNFNIYPNPNNGSFTLTSEKNEPKKISIMNTVGAIIFETEIASTSATIQLSGVASGFYFIRLEQGGLSAVHRIVVSE